MSAKELKQRRLALQLTQVELAILTGIPQSSISRLERSLYPQRPLLTPTACLLEKTLDDYGQQRTVSRRVSFGGADAGNQSIERT